MTSSKIKSMPYWVQIFAQALQIALGWHQNARRAGHRFDDDGSNGGGVMQSDDVEQRIGFLDAAMLRAPARKGILCQIMGVRQVVNARQQGTEMHAVLGNASNGNATKARFRDSRVHGR